MNKLAYVLQCFAVWALSFLSAKAAPPVPVPIPCPQDGGLCISIQVLFTDPTHGTITVNLSTQVLQEMILKDAQAYMNANLPPFLTSEVVIFPLRYLNGSIILHTVVIGGNVFPPLPPHPGPPHCGTLGHPPCPTLQPNIGFAQGISQVDIQLVDEYQKEEDHWGCRDHSAGCGWHQGGNVTVGQFTVFGDAAVAVDPIADLSKQSAVFTYRGDHVAGNITLKKIQGPFSFSLNGKTVGYSVRLVDPATANQYGLNAFNASSLTISSINRARTVLTATIAPAVH
jgi:hypothetical protein